VIDSTDPTAALTSAGTITNAEPTINLESANNAELVAEIGYAHVIDDTNITPSLDAKYF